MNTVGHLQRCLLHDMRAYSGNRYCRTRVTAEDRRMLGGLHGRGLITTNDETAVLTAAGKAMADDIITEAWGRAPVAAGDTITLVKPRGPQAWAAHCGTCKDASGLHQWCCHLDGHADVEDANACAQRHAIEHQHN